MYWRQTAKRYVLLPELKVERRGVRGRAPVKFEMRSVHATRIQPEIRLREVIQWLNTEYICEYLQPELFNKPHNHSTICQL